MLAITVELSNTTAVAIILIRRVGSRTRTVARTLSLSVTTRRRRHRHSQRLIRPPIVNLGEQGHCLRRLRRVGVRSSLLKLSPDLSFVLFMFE